MPIEDRSLKPETKLVAKYKGKEHTAEVIAAKDGAVRYRLADGREFRSPSAAGKAVMGGVACNGWKFWSVAGAEPEKTAAAASASPPSRPTSPDAARTANGGPTAPATQKAADSAPTGHTSAQRTAAPKANGSKPGTRATGKATGRKTARKPAKRTATARKR